MIKEKNFKIATFIVLAWLLFLLVTGCSTEDKKTINTISHDDMEVTFLDMELNQTKENISGEGFAVWLQLKDLKGRAVGGKNYTFLFPITATDNHGNKYESKSTAIFDRNRDGEPLPTGTVLLELFFTPNVKPKAGRLNIDFKIQPTFFDYPATSFSSISLHQGKIQKPEITLESIEVDEKLGHIRVELSQEKDKAEIKQVSLQSALVSSGGKKLKAIGIGRIIDSENNKVLYQLDFPDQIPPGESVNLLVEWEAPDDIIWKFPLKNIPVT